jgi:hypothetical protein
MQVLVMISITGPGKKITVPIVRKITRREGVSIMWP